MIKKILKIKKLYKILIIIGITTTIAVLVHFNLKIKNDNSSQAGNDKMIYVNLLQETQFQVSKNWILEDIVVAKNIILYPDKEAMKMAQVSEENFYNTGNIQVKMLREIPGKEQVFDYFVENEFEKILSSEKKEWTKEKFITETGYNGYRFKITKPFEYLYIIIDSPVAYWVSAKNETDEVKKIANSLKPIEEANKTEAKKSSFVLDEFIKKMKNGSFDELFNLSTDDFKQKYSEEALAGAIKNVKDSLNRTFVIVSVRFNEDTTYTRGVLENQDKNNPQYGLVTAELKKVGNEYKINAIQIDKDRKGTPSQQAKPQTPASAQELLEKTK